tara:strand:+ start:45 stop:989 length:945 start_codon:yes stop_codon:yes gene_type:complete
MDHKVSKDMISNGMIPSGEKTQSDLGRTQYGSAPSPNTLLNAYKSIYEHHQKDKDGNTIPHEDVKEGVGTVVGGVYGAKKDGLKGAIVGGTAGAMIDSLNKPKKKNAVKTEEAEPVNEILGMAAGAIGAKLVGGAAAKVAAKGAMKSALTKGATSQAARSAAMKAGQSAGMKAGTSAALNYGAAGSVAGSALKSGSNVLSGGSERKRTISADADLFDIVKGKLLDEGLTEEESLDVMLTLTLEEINEVVKLDEVTAGLLMKAAKAAEVARGKAAVMGNKALAVKKMGQGEKFYKGAVAKRKAAGQMGAGYKEGM